ncbi:MAG TPA: hypothetical protein VM689_06565 [Aliidongia sp.]|nr:hypothetical protein [Aliidongia sp.]
MIRSGMPTQNSLADLVSQAISALAVNDIATALPLIAAIQGEQPDSALAYHLVGLASLRLNEPGKSVEALEQAHRIAPSAREPVEVLSVLFSKLGRVVDSLYYKKLGIAATETIGFPELVPSWIGNFDEAFFSIEEQPLLREAEKHAAAGNFAGAATAYRKEIEADHHSVEGRRGLARMNLQLGQPYAGLAAMAELRELDRGEPADLALYGELLAQAGRFDEAQAMQQTAARQVPDDARLGWGMVRTLARWPDYPRQAVGTAMAAWADMHPPMLGRPEKAAAEAFDGRHLRLGILSTSWANGGGLDLLVPTLERLDRRLIKLHAYASGVVNAPLARRIRARADDWQDLSELDDDTASLILRNDELDILIDLDGPTRTERPGLIAGGPAGLVLSLYGSPEGSRALGCDGVLGCEHAYPPDAPHVLRVAGGLATLPVDLPAVKRARPAGSPCCFGTIAARWQIGPATIAAWAEILHACPDSHLVLDLDLLGGPAGADEFSRMLQPYLPVDRVLLKTGQSRLADYLDEIDVLLDPLDNPHPDDAVAALALGLPVVTCRSETPRAAILAGWLSRLGLDRLVAADEHAYVAAAVVLADADVRNAQIEAMSEAVAGEQRDGAASRAANLARTLIGAARSGILA